MYNNLNLLNQKKALLQDLVIESEKKFLSLYKRI